ncbi:MAG: Na+/H+ antiporter NhaC family protein [Bacteroidales bacterium]|nr:Na+/H+ antiporter NhaC family protein [Bacteroidales bacterium]
MPVKRWLIVCLLLLLPGIGFTQLPQTNFDQDELEVDIPGIIVKSISYSINIRITDSAKAAFYDDTEIPVMINGKEEPVFFDEGTGTITKKFKKKVEFAIAVDEYSYSEIIRPIPLWMSILPPLIAIGVALLLREVFAALFLGLLVGTTIISFYKGISFILAIFNGIFLMIDSYILESMHNTGHLSIIIFSMLIGGMVNVITRNGGMKGIVNILSRYAKSPKSGQIVTWVLGILIFFDDYANTLVVGNTMRPVTDRLKISREKLAYIVDSTAAPIAAIAFVTTWIGAELGYIQDGINTIGLDESAYDIFINSLRFSFYPIFALIFIIFLASKGRDFGPMVKAERKARNTGKYDDSDKNTFSNKLNELEVEENIKARWYNAAIPVLIVIFGTIAGLIYTGLEVTGWNEELSFTKNLSTIIGNADSYRALLWSSLSGVLVAIILTITQKLLSLKDSVDSLINGFRTMLTAIVILVLAWAIALVTKHMHTADFISQILIEVNMAPFLVPVLTFILAALVAFSTGSSWGTMAILYPLILPSTWLITQEAGFGYDESMMIFYNVVSTVLAGSVLGDHCSPISDTTILSSLASSCNHIDHVRTQLPYALTVGTVAIVFGTLPAAWGISSLFLFPAGLIMLYLIVHFFGKRT